MFQNRLWWTSETWWDNVNSSNLLLQIFVNWQRNANNWSTYNINVAGLIKPSQTSLSLRQNAIRERWPPSLLLSLSRSEDHSLRYPSLSLVHIPMGIWETDLRCTHIPPRQSMEPRPKRNSHLSFKPSQLNSKEEMSIMEIYVMPEKSPMISY